MRGAKAGTEDSRSAGRALIGALLLVALAAAGCPDRCADRPAATSITLWHTFNSEETGTLNRILDRLRSTHPDWRIQTTVIPFTRAQNEFRRAAQGCGPGAPDIFRTELPWLADFVSNKLILPVPGHLTDSALLLPQARRAAEYLGESWARPANLDCLALFYDRRQITRPPRTLAELIAAAQAVTRDRLDHAASDPGFNVEQVRRWGFYVRSDAYWFLPFLWAGGGDLLDPNTGEIFIDDVAAIEALQLYRDLIHKYKVAPPRPSPADDYEDQMERFSAGELAMMINGPWAMAALLAQPAFKDPGRLGIAPLPAGPGGRAAAPYSGHGYVVSRCSRSPMVAWRVARELSGERAQVEFARRNSLLPTLTAAYEQPGVGQNPFIARFRAALEHARYRPKHPAMARIFDDFTPAVQAVIAGNATPAEALGGVARAWRKLLEVRPK